MISLVLTALLALTSHAQMSQQESDGRSQFSVFGREFNTSFFSLASVETDQVQSSGGRVSTYNFISANSYLDNGMRLAVRLPFVYNTAGTERGRGPRNNSQEFLLQDVFVSLQNFNIALLPWDLGLFWEGRAYAPTSEFSRNAGMILRLRNDFIVSKVFSRRFESEYVQRFNYYWQSRTTYTNRQVDEDGFTFETTSLTKQAELDHWFTTWYKFTPQTALGLRVGAEHSTWNSSTQANRSRPMETILKGGVQVRFPVNDRANFILVFDDRVDARNNAAEFGRFLARNTEITALSFIRF